MPFSPLLGFQENVRGNKENMFKVMLAITQWNIRNCSADSMGYFEGEFKYLWSGRANDLTRNFAIQNPYLQKVKSVSDLVLVVPSEKTGSESSEKLSENILPLAYLRKFWCAESGKEFGHPHF